MLFHSLAFILAFLPLCLAVFFLIGRIGGRAWALGWLLGASLVFYGCWDPALVPLLLGSVLFNWRLGRHIAHQATHGPVRLWFGLGVASNLGLLGWFKYAGFVVGMVVPEGTAPDIVLPLAISFFTFQQIMALAECLPAPGAPPPARRSLLSHAAFVAFFPHLIAGPLVRPREIVPQLEAPDLAVPQAANLTRGGTIFLLGLGKKLVLADLFARFADPAFDAVAAGAALSVLEAWSALLAYALQIYFDFSGYSDMAIGLALMFNIRFPLNFDSPYQARSISDFWRRWHITLGLFLRDFVYIPLGGSRSGLVRRIGAVMATMLLCGLWHGAAWQFVVWGGIHGVLLVIHVLYRRVGPPLPGPVAWGLTLLCVVLAWVPFRAADLSTAWAFLQALGGANGLALPVMIVDFVPLLSAIAEPVPLLPYLGDARTLSVPEVAACLVLGWGLVLVPTHLHLWSERRRAWAVVGGCAFTVQALFFASDVAPFLYFQF